MFLFMSRVRNNTNEHCSSSFSSGAQDVVPVPGTRLLVRCLVEIGVTLVARNTIFRSRCKGPGGAGKMQVRGPRGPRVRPLYLLNLQLRNSIMKDRRFFFLFFFSFLDRSGNATCVAPSPTIAASGILRATRPSQWSES